MILMIDNYDSFTYNLYQYIGSIRPDIKVIRNDAMTVDELRELPVDHIVISPGPGRPEDAGICMDVIKAFKGQIPILGVCLGEQAICTAYGAHVGYASMLMHGKASMTTLDLTSPIFQGLSQAVPVARYHSLALKKETIGRTTLRITATAEDGEVMAVEDRDNHVYGVQFHPESIMTPDGMKMLENFLNISIS